ASTSSPDSVSIKAMPSPLVCAIWLNQCFNLCALKALKVLGAGNTASIRMALIKNSHAHELQLMSIRRSLWVTASSSQQSSTRRLKYFTTLFFGPCAHHTAFLTRWQHNGL